MLSFRAHVIDTVFSNNDRKKGKKHRKKGDKFFMDRKTCTLAHPMQSHDAESTEYKFLLMIEKVLQFELFFPDCLPEHWEKRTGWLEDNKLRRQCIRDILHPGGILTLTNLPAFFTSKKSFRLSESFDGFRPGSIAAIADEAENLRRDQFMILIDFGTSIKPDEQDVLGGICTLKFAPRKEICTRPFRRPKLKRTETGSFCLDYRACDGCGKSEQVTRTFMFCSRCH